MAIGERKMFLEVWLEREHHCENCDKYLGNEPIAHYFSHIKPKSTHPELRLDKNNIQLICMECHYAFDNQGLDEFNQRKDKYGNRGNQDQTE